MLVSISVLGMVFRTVVCPVTVTVAVAIAVVGVVVAVAAVVVDVDVSVGVSIVVVSVVVGGVSVVVGISVGDSCSDVWSMLGKEFDPRSMNRQAISTAAIMAS